MEKTINEVFKNRTAQYGSRLAVEKKHADGWESATWSQYYDRARAVGLALLSMGIKKGDRVAVLSENRLEWLYTDMGTLGIGACLVPIYTTLTPKEVAYIVLNSGAKILFAEDRTQIKKAILSKAQCPDLEKVVVMEADTVNANEHAFITPFADLIKKGGKAHDKNGHLFKDHAANVTPDDLATIVYTSGTTGTPKGAMITHGNIMSVIRSLDKIRPHFASDRDRAVPFLPLSHVFERAAGHFYGMYTGITSSYAKDITSVLEDFAEKKPTIILAVPRVCEKVYRKIMIKVEQQPAWRQKIFFWGHEIGCSISAFREQKKKPPLHLRLKYKLAYALVFKKLSQALGGRVRWMTASGAPTAREIILFFNAAGIQVVEGYGMTECFAPATMSNLDDYKIGTVGRPLPDVEIKTDENGEILIRGSNVFKGYWQMEDETRESFTKDGFLKSGDIGNIDADGFLTITDRKKNLIITSGGKNIAPQKIETLFLSDPLFLHFLVIGEKRRFLSALLTLDPDQAMLIARKKKIPFTTSEDLITDPLFIKEVHAHVDRKNQALAQFETIKQFRIIGHEFSQEKGELTPSLKLKRNVIQQNYKHLIDEMYKEPHSKENPL